MSGDKFNKKKAGKGRKRCTTSVDDRRIKKLCFRDKRILLTSIRSDLNNAGISVSSKTTRSRLADRNRSTCWTKPRNCDEDLSSLAAGGNDGPTLLIAPTLLHHGQVTKKTPELVPPFPNYHTTPTGGRLSFRQIERTSLPYTAGFQRLLAGTHDTPVTSTIPWPLGNRGLWTPFAAEWNVHKASIATFTLVWKPQAMNAGLGQRN
ncbi:hypothetical protein TNCV_1485431 [Trichonephila clavipes]|nr:hypothetical protein TNCV_1485431 [Trichonephila clavipes]